jgi:hypothetical protein
MSIAAPVSLTGTGQIIPAAPGFQIIVLSCALVARTAVDVKFQNGTSVTDLIGAIPLAANAGFVLPLASRQDPWMKVNPGEPLNLNMSTGAYVGGVVIYDLI